MSGVPNPVSSTPNRPPGQQPPVPQGLGRAPLARVPPARRTARLRKSDLEDKLLITRNSGRKFGSLGEAWVDPRRLWVALFDVVDSGLVPALGSITTGKRRGGVYVKSLREVGDVVLIQNDQDFCPEARVNRQGLTLLSGLKIKMETGELLGKVRDFVFDPNNGRIERLVFDGLGLPYLPIGLVDEFAVDVREITRIVIPEGVIYVRTSAQYMQITSGKFNFLKSFGSILEFMNGNDGQGSRSGQQEPEDNFEMLEEKYQRVLEESRKQQEAYYAMYGSQVPGLRPQQGPPASQPQPGTRPAPQENQPVPRAGRLDPRQQNRTMQQRSTEGNKQPQIDDWLVQDPRTGGVYEEELMNVDDSNSTWSRRDGQPPPFR